MIDDSEVGVIYMRCGYHPDQYPTQAEWDARLMMERSLAVKSPSINYHLAGTKKVQQELARAGQVEKFLGDNVQISAVEEIFTGLYSLDHVSQTQPSHQSRLTFLISGRDWRQKPGESHRQPSEICPEASERGRGQQCVR